MKIEVVVFAQKHAAPCAELEKICFSEPWTERQLAESAQSELYRMFAAECDGVFAGYCAFQYIPDEGYVTNVAVFPQYRRCGVGDALIAEMLDYGEKLGMDFITLEVRAGNTAAQSLYAKHGFERAGLRRCFYSEPQEDALIMTKFFGKI